MAARRCDACDELWPVGHEKCPRCERPTAYRPSETPVRSSAEAASAIAHRTFDQYYERRERDRELRGDVSPDVLGRLDARRDIAALRSG